MKTFNQGLKRFQIKDMMHADSLFQWEGIDEGDTQLILSPLTVKEKLEHFKSPDYCFITPARTVLILLLELQPLCTKTFGS